MGLALRIITVFMFLVFSSSISIAAWYGPTEIVTGGWGSADNQFGIRYEDTDDTFPRELIVLLNGDIWIPDGFVNRRLKLYDSSGNLKKIISYDEHLRSFPDYWFIGTYEAISANGNVYTSSYMGQDLYALYSPTGQLIKTVAQRPLELGRFKRKYLSPNSYLYSVQYPDATFSVSLPWELLRKYQRVNLTTIVLVAQTPGPDKVYRASSCGKVLGEMQMPETKWNFVEMSGVEEINELEVEYGNPVIGPNGDVYAWKRTPDNYSILKWTWQDDPNAPADVPDAPTNLTVATGANGLTLRWKAPLQDPGCVSEYEIARSTVAQGAFTSIGTAPSGSFTYTDTTAEAGLTYYYKVRAKGGSGYSDYTNEASGQY